MGERGLVFRRLDAADLVRLGDVDRAERIEALYRQRGTEMVKEYGDFDSPAWDAEGDGEHSVAHYRRECEQYLARGGTGFVAFAGERMVGIGIVVPHIRPGIAQLAFLHVANGHRARGVGGRLTREMERVARETGDHEMVVSATPSVNTVAFYMRMGFAPMAEPLPELFAREPEDVHLWKELG